MNPTPFAGILRFDGQAIPEVWEELLAGALGPGTGGVFRAPGLSFVGAPGACASGDPDAERILLSDLRLDGREDLALRLGHASSPDPEAGDAALLALAQTHWGDQAAGHLLGEFAFAVWQPACRKLLLARDRLGARAMYYHAWLDGFAFASDLRALLALPWIPRDLCAEKAADILCGDPSGPAGSTWYEAIRSLPAAHVLVLDRGQARVRPYWTPPPPPACGSRVPTDPAHELRERIGRAVEDQLRGGLKVAVHLSGGLDSSAIACIAARRLKREGRRLLALCAVLPRGYAGPETDERRYIEAVLAQEDNIDPVWVETGLERDPFGALPRWFAALGFPPYSTVTHIEEALGEAGAAHGVDVVLSGFGGDFFASAPGSRVLPELLRSGHWRAACAVLRAWHRELGTGWGGWGRWSRLLGREILAPVRSLLRPARECAHGARPELLERIARQRGRRPQTTAGGALGSHEMMRLILAPGHLELPVATLRQVFCHAFGQQMRFPLLDMRVIELMLATPVEQLVQDGWPRGLMRRAMRGILPELIRCRLDKGGAFDPALTSRFIQHRQALGAWAERTRGHACWGYVDRDRFLEVLGGLAGRPRAEWRGDFFRVVVMGGMVARFIQWQDAPQAVPWR